MTAPRGAPSRAATAQRDAWRTLRLVGAFLLAALVVGLPGGESTRWVALHLLLVGGILGAISAASQLFAVTWSSSPAPPRSAVTAQRWLLAGGAVVLVVGRHRGAPTVVTAAGGSAVVLALALLAWILWWIRGRAVTDRFAPAIDAYLLALAVGVVGTGIGVGMVAGGIATASSARDAHIALNLFGLVGLVVAGTLPTFVATQVRAKVSPRATSARVRATAAALGAATLMAAGGLLAEARAVAATGFVAYALVAASTFRTLPMLGPKQRSWAGPRLLQLLTAMAWWAAAAVWAALWSLGRVGEERLWLLLGVAAYAQLVVGSLAYLGPIIRGRDHEAQPRAFRITRSWFSLAAGNALALALVVGWWPGAAICAAAWGLDLVVRAVVLVTRVRPSPLPSGG
jgi:nitrite reductase (NO-forming)